MKFEKKCAGGFAENTFDGPADTGGVEAARVAPEARFTSRMQRLTGLLVR
jgi:hypothetical protein